MVIFWSKYIENAYSYFIEAIGTLWKRQVVILV
jgi:hypothetical protein